VGAWHQKFPGPQRPRSTGPGDWGLRIPVLLCDNRPNRGAPDAIEPSTFVPEKPVPTADSPKFLEVSVFVFLETNGDGKNGVIYVL